MKAPLYHICSDENHSDIFFSDYDFKTAMNILAMCIALFDDIELYAFVLMSNHLHLLVGGPKDIIDAFFKMFVKSLSKYFRAEGKPNLVSDLNANCHLIEDCEHLLNVIVYIHRNPCVIDWNSSPYTYRWGSGRYYFNPEAVQRYNTCKRRITLCQRQQYSHSRKFDGVVSLFETDNYISPLSFCRISECEEMFGSASRYLFLLTRNIESTKSIAAEIGEHVSYSDSEMYSIVRKLSFKECGTSDLNCMSPEQKISLARILHYEYNSGNKQISRLLKLDISITDNLFPQSSAGRLRRNRQ